MLTLYFIIYNYFCRVNIKNSKIKYLKSIHDGKPILSDRYCLDSNLGY